MKTYSAKPTDITRTWYVLDASQLPLGRLSTKAAELLLGKAKPQFTHHIDCGDYVIIINASKLVITGNKLKGKTYYHYSGYPSGLKQASLEEKMAKDSTAPIKHAIRGMLPDNKLRDPRLLRLKVYPGCEHQHEAQKPVTLNLKKGKP
ncbi:MAG: 50S ribosomal protein L13 [Candidatus Saccharimonadales bacterium]